MPNIENSFTEFNLAIKQGKSVVLKETGVWYCEGAYSRIIRRIFRLEDQRVALVAKVFNKTLDKLEKIPVKFNAGNGSAAPEQTQKFQQYIETAKTIAEMLESHKKNRNCRLEKRFLDQKKVAMQYRIESINGGLDTLASPELQAPIQDLARKWKNSKEQSFFNDKELTPSDLHKIAQTCAYPDFAKLIVADKYLQDAFFKWTLRENNDVRPFVEFPATYTRLKTAYMAGRIGRCGAHLLSVDKIVCADGKEEKQIRLTFEGKKISILDESQEVTLKGNYKLTVKKIIDVFKSKNDEIGNLEYFPELGVTNWNAHELGWWNPEKKDFERIDLTKDDWWKDLPIFERATREQVEKRYSSSKFPFKLEPNQWAAAAKSSRETPTLDFDRSHGYFEFCVPQSDGTYLIFNFGKFAANFPKNFFEKILFLTATAKGKFSYPDENLFYSHRQHASVPFAFSKEKGLELMKIVKEELLKARNGSVVFQFAWENCAYWPQTLLETLLGKEKDGGRVPDLYHMDLLKAEPSNGFLRKMVNLINKTPKSWRPKLMTGVHTILGSWRKYHYIENGQRKWKSLAATDFPKCLQHYQPSLTHKNIEAGKLQGVLNYAHGA